MCGDDDERKVLRALALLDGDVQMELGVLTAGATQLLSVSMKEELNF